MFAYRDRKNNMLIEIFPEKVPWVMAIRDSKGVDHEYDLDGNPTSKNVLDSEFDYKVKQWVDLNSDWVSEAVWEICLNLKVESAPRMDLKMLTMDKVG